MRYFAIVSYKGTNYQGWQRQPDVLTIQEVIEATISKILNEQIVIVSSGRTDAGVHANGQTFHFDTTKDLDLHKFRYSLNCVLPKDIHIKSIKLVDDNFHARFSATGKHYVYYINQGENDPFDNEITYSYKRKIDIKKLKESLMLFVGKHDFKDFSSKDIDDKKFVRNIYKIDVKKTRGSTIKIHFYGDGFMRYQIRFMVGTALAVIENKITNDDILYHLSEKEEREIVRFKAPSEGLFLDEVLY